MSNVKLETLTAVHVGSGNFLQNRTEFFQSGNALYVTDERKVLDIIGTNHVQEWIQSISQRNSIVDVVHRFAPHAAPDTFSKRRMECYNNLRPYDTLKESIHDGQGKPYIPGSSIKGAIRSAALATEAEKRHLKTASTNASDSERLLFGKDPNHDIFRFLQVGDAFFKSGSEIATRLVMHLNMTERSRNLVTIEKPQLIEAIREKCRSSFRLNINQNGLTLTQKYLGIQTQPFFMSSIPALINMCNEHTIKLLNRELDFWDAQKNYQGAEKYLNAVDEILEKAEQCLGTNSCVLRLGHAVGWEFITGGWVRDEQGEIPEMIIKKARPHNDRYESYPFPKSRRAEESLSDDRGGLIGFVKLTLED